MSGYELAQRYYPKLWPLARLEALLAAGKLTPGEFEELVAGTGGEVVNG